MTVFIADDHTLFRKGLIQILEEDASLEIVGEAGDGQSAMDAIQKLQPDVALIDIGMPDPNGLVIAETATQNQWSTSIVILTMYNEEEYLNKALDLGVKGYLLKENAVSDLMSCLHAVEAGRYYVSPVFSEFLVRRRARSVSLLSEYPMLDQLTNTELEVLRHVAENRTSREIAEDLHISHRTVQTHRTNICKKLGFSGHNKLLHFAIQHRATLLDITRK